MCMRNEDLKRLHEIEEKEAEIRKILYSKELFKKIILNNNYNYNNLSRIIYLEQHAKSDGNLAYNLYSEFISLS